LKGRKSLEPREVAKKSVGLEELEHGFLVERFSLAPGAEFLARFL